MPAPLIILTTTETNRASEAIRHYDMEGEFPHRLIDPQTSEVMPLRKWGENPRDSVIPTDAGNTGPLRQGQVYHVDILGYANRLPADGVWWENLAVIVTDLAAETKTPLEFPKQFMSYLEGCGPGPHRLELREFAKAVGVIGQQHIPLANMGNPGDLRIMVEMLAAADPIEGSAGHSIQESLAQAGLFEGPQNGVMDANTAVAVERLVNEYMQRGLKIRAMSTTIEELTEQAAPDDLALIADTRHAVHDLVELLWSTEIAEPLEDTVNI